MNLDQFHTYQEQTFDSFCKTVIRNESIDAFRELARRREHEIEFSALSSKELALLIADDTYGTYRKSFRVLEYIVEVCDQSLGEILLFIPPVQRNIVLLSYFLGYSDLEIGRLLKINKNTVHYRRKATLERLRKMLEEMEHV